MERSKINPVVPPAERSKGNDGGNRNRISGQITKEIEKINFELVVPPAERPGEEDNTGSIQIAKRITEEIEKIKNHCRYTDGKAKGRGWRKQNSGTSKNNGDTRKGPKSLIEIGSGWVTRRWRSYQNSDIDQGNENIGNSKKPLQDG